MRLWFTDRTNNDVKGLSLCWKQDESSPTHAVWVSQQVLLDLIYKGQLEPLAIALNAEIRRVNGE